jgi:hypothetical protein
MTEGRIRRFRVHPIEDLALRELVLVHGLTAWPMIASRLPGRNARQCRDRWNHYLSRLPAPEPTKAVKPNMAADEPPNRRRPQPQPEAEKPNTFFATALNPEGAASSARAEKRVTGTHVNLDAHPKPVRPLGEEPGFLTESGGLFADFL